MVYVQSPKLRTLLVKNCSLANLLSRANAAAIVECFYCEQGSRPYFRHWSKSTTKAVVAVASEPKLATALVFSTCRGEQDTLLV